MKKRKKSKNEKKSRITKRHRRSGSKSVSKRSGIKTHKTKTKRPSPNDTTRNRRSAAKIKKKTILTPPSLRSSTRSKLKYLYELLKRAPIHKPNRRNDYNAFQRCLSDFLKSIGHDKWAKFGSYSDICRLLWKKHKGEPISRLCQNIDAIFYSEYNTYFPTRKKDMECIQDQFFGSKWFNFKDALYSDLIISECTKLSDKIYFIGEDNVISNKDISPDNKGAIDDLHEELNQLFFDRPSPPPRVELLEIEETKHGRLIIKYTIEAESQFKDVTHLPFGQRSEYLKHDNIGLLTKQQIEDEDDKKNKQHPIPKEEVKHTPEQPHTRTAEELQAEQRILDTKLELLKAAERLGLKGDDLKRFLGI